MRIKKHNGNQYLLTNSNKWVRNFTNPIGAYFDKNETITTEDQAIFLKNEIQNGYSRNPWIDSENIFHEKILIVSDGFDFESKHKIIDNLKRDVAIIAVNGALAKWKSTRSPNYYVVNNPYKECMRYLPKGGKIQPKCIASNRTNSDFLKNYKGNKYRYFPVSEKNYSSIGNKEVKWQIDDYRNPICAALGLAYRFGAEKIVLLSCDDSFSDKRDGAIQLENNLWTYPQQVIAQEIIDANLYWLKNQEHKEVEIYYNSSGIIYKNASYIETDVITSL